MTLCVTHSVDPSVDEKCHHTRHRIVRHPMAVATELAMGMGTTLGKSHFMRARGRSEHTKGIPPTLKTPSQVESRGGKPFLGEGFPRERQAAQGYLTWAGEESQALSLGSGEAAGSI